MPEHDSPEGAALPGAGAARGPVPRPLPPVPPPPASWSAGGTHPVDSPSGGTAGADGASSGREPVDREPTADVGDYVGPLRSFWARTPLRARLIGIVTIMLLAGLGLSVALTTTVLSRYLTDQLDRQLQVTARQVATQVVKEGTSTSSDSPFSNDYYTVFYWADGSPAKSSVQRDTVLKYGLPQLTPYTLADSESTTGIFTVRSTDVAGTGATSPWRAISVTYGDLATGYVALPLEPVQTTVAQIQRILVVSALVLTVLGTAAGYVAIRRSLRPLSTIERTAAAIADGDLSMRVPQAPVQTEVGSLAQSLNSMLTQIEQSFDAQEASEARMRRFVSDASHELRTPLATVRGYGELYRMGALTTPEAMDDTMRRIEDSATRMGTLVNDLLALARLDEGRPVGSEPVDLVRLARDSADDLHALDPTRTVTLVGLDGGPPPERLVVLGDEDRLRQVFTNLIGNVAQHTPAGTAAEIALGPATDGTSAVEVRDHGQGIPAEQADRVFERFYRADSSRNRSSGGSGLGMAIVAAIVAAHHGDVSISQTPGGGLTVRLTVPTA